MKYVSLPTDEEQQKDLLAISTEDGRVIFYSTEKLQDVTDEESTIPEATVVAQLGGKQAGFPGRIKDFEVLSLTEQAKEIRDGFLVVTGNSDGVVRIWKISSEDLTLAKGGKDSKETRQIGKVLSVYETGNRITCLASFIMLPAEDPSTLLGEEDDDEDEDDTEESSSDDSDDE